MPCEIANPAVLSISAFFPCYNDEATIESVVRTCVETLEALHVDADITVVNDGSTDGSENVLKRLVEAEPMVSVLTHERNRGYGGALLSGFASATKEWVFYTDGDGQFDPAQLSLLVQRADDSVDVVQGYKLRRSDSAARRIIGRVYHRVVAFMFGLRIRDTDCDFRLIRRSKLEEVHLERTTGAICVEMVRKLQDAGARFVEVGVDHYPRLHNRSQFFRIHSVARSLWDVAQLWVEFILRPRLSLRRR